MIEFAQEYPLLHAMFIALIMIVATTLVHYEVLQICEKMIPKILWLHGRIRIVVIVLGAFIGHVIAIWMYAVCYYLMIKLGLGGLAGVFTGAYEEYLYYSTVSYTSLGLGDMFPTGALTFLTGVEALNGLVLITWSASYTYLYMSKFWK